MEIDRDGEMPVEMARTLLWEHQGIELTNEHTLVSAAPAPNAPRREEVSLEVPPGGAIRPELLGMSAGGLPSPA